MPTPNFSRRIFLAASAASALTGCATSTTSTSDKPLGANDDIRVAMVGLHGRGGQVIKEVRANKGVRVAALCDCDSNVLADHEAKCKKLGENVKTYTDIRKLLDDKEIDAVVLTIPNYWHALGTVWACQAGKDVYVEKPISYCIWEGPQMMAAAKKYGRMVQSGTQRRSDKGFYELVDYLQSGKLGKIQYVRTLCYRDRSSIGKVSGPQPVPAYINYDLHCGPAPCGPLMRKNLHYDWHWVWPTGNGDVGNQGIHEIDQARWILGYPKLPPRVFSLGGRFLWNDDGTTPNTQIAVWGYDIPIVTEVRNFFRKAGEKVMDAYKGTRVGVYVHCEGGYYTGGENGGWSYDHKDNKIKQFVQEGVAQHTNNFFHAMRTRKQSDLTAPLGECHVSSAMCHMANISYQVGKQMGPGQIMEIIKGDKVAAETWANYEQHLKANNVDFGKEPPTMGAMLSFDPGAERFTGELSVQANALVKREYRAPYVVPDNV
ncbi:MAG: Gfo/Idh/MocA family protein [Tepidisphaerales bacterium]